MRSEDRVNRTLPMDGVTDEGKMVLRFLTQVAGPNVPVYLRGQLNKMDAW